MLELRNLTKRYGGEAAVDGVSFTVEEGELASLLGPSGSGKTTVLETVAGLQRPDEGRVYLHGEDVTDSNPEDRDVGVVFQTSSLFPRMTVRENVEYALAPHVEDAGERRQIAEEHLELVEMSDRMDAAPTALSGGEARRVELARALSYEPDVLLLDEPLTGLDRELRSELLDEIRRIQIEEEVTTLYVTHDQEEAISISDRIAVLADGEKQQEGSPRQIYRRPETRFVAEFVGDSTRLDGVVGDGSKEVRLDSGATVMVNGRGDGEEGDEASVYVRPENVDVARDATLDNVFPGEVVEVVEKGSHAEARVETEEGEELLSKIEGFPDVEEGDDVVVGFDDSDAIVVAEESD